ncbi:MAG: hypothetical protein BAJALOKI2v1_40055 [Promethearchaeota archaeon]|nr:MAG: hypothetical protein BAJALOKI2v1_40055 [Candidatus Lokiarchaeota archaeon]
MGRKMKLDDKISPSNCDILKIFLIVFKCNRNYELLRKVMW